MQSKLVPGRVRKPAEAQRLRDRALDVGLCIYLCVYCAVGMCLAFGLYDLMQPTRYPNPGMSTYTPPFRSVLVLASPIEPEAKAEGREVKVDDAVAEQPSKAPNPDHATAAAATKRTRTAHLKGRDSMPGRGAEPAYGGYRPWNGYQAWGSYRPWNGYQSWGSYRAWR